MLLTLSQREELLFIEEPKRMQRNDDDLTIHAQVNVSELYLE